MASMIFFGAHFTCETRYKIMSINPLSHEQEKKHDCFLFVHDRFNTATEYQILFFFGK